MFTPPKSHRSAGDVVLLNAFQISLYILHLTFIHHIHVFSRFVVDIITCNIIAKKERTPRKVKKLSLLQGYPL